MINKDRFEKSFVEITKFRKFKMAPQNTRPRIKLFVLNDVCQWDDRGTAYVTLYSAVLEGKISQQNFF